MKSLIAIAAPLLLAGSLSAEWSKDAEERFQMKYGRPSPVATQREAAAKKSAAKPEATFEALDANRDGVISREEWKKQKAPQTPPAAKPDAGARSGE